MSRAKKAFTLAEVLITLTIVGIIASMTIPSLVSNVQGQVLNVAWKKAYSNASQAWMLAVAENPNTYTAKGGWTCTWPTGETQNYEEVDGRTDAFKAKFNVVKSCVNQDGCWPSVYENVGGQLIGHDVAPYLPRVFSWIASDGMCWAAPYYNIDQTHIMVDTNCEKGPNKIGQDIFSMFLGADGIIYLAIGDRSPNGKPVSSGNVCPYVTAPATINGRSVDFASGLMNQNIFFLA